MELSSTGLYGGLGKKLRDRSPVIDDAVSTESESDDEEAMVSLEELNHVTQRLLQEEDMLRVRRQKQSVMREEELSRRYEALKRRLAAKGCSLPACQHAEGGVAPGRMAAGSVCAVEFRPQSSLTFSAERPSYASAAFRWVRQMWIPVQGKLVPHWNTSWGKGSTTSSV